MPEKDELIEWACHVGVLFCRHEKNIDHNFLRAPTFGISPATLIGSHGHFDTLPNRRWEIESGFADKVLSPLLLGFKNFNIAAIDRNLALK